MLFLLKNTVRSTRSFKIMALLDKIQACQYHLDCFVSFVKGNALCIPKVPSMEMVF